MDFIEARMTAIFFLVNITVALTGISAVLILGVIPGIIATLVSAIAVPAVVQYFFLKETVGEKGEAS